TTAHDPPRQPHHPDLVGHRRHHHGPHLRLRRSRQPNKITDAQNNTWLSAYSLLGQITAKSDPDAGNSTMLYDGAGNLTQTTNSRGKTISYAYDPINRKTGQFNAPATAQS